MVLVIPVVHTQQILAVGLRGVAAAEVVQVRMVPMPLQVPVAQVAQVVRAQLRR